MKWVICPNCDLVQPVSQPFVDLDGSTKSRCRDCTIGAIEYGDCDEPYGIDVAGYEVTPTEQEKEVFFKEKNHD